MNGLFSLTWFLFKVHHTRYYIYNKSISELKWKSYWETCLLQIQMNPQFWFFAQLSDHWLNLFCHAFNDYEKVIEKLVCYKFRWTHNFDSLHNWVITDSICSAMRSMISGCSPHVHFFGLHLERFLNTSVDKESNAFCIFASLCSTLVYG